MNDRTDAVLAAIDGALMDPEIPDGMRWSPQPEQVSDPTAVPYDGEIVPQPHQTYEADQPSVMPLGIAVRANLRRRAEQVQADAALPRVSVHYNPRVAAPVPADMPVPVDGLLAVEEHGDGLITVRRATPEEISQVIADAWQAVVETFTPLVESMRDAFRGFTPTLRRAGWAPIGPPTTPEARRSLGLPPLSPADARTAALDARRHRNTGPAPLGPERSPRPRTHR